jgi:hypothetical protein
MPRGTLAKMLVIAWTLMKKKEVFNPSCIEESKFDYYRRDSPIKNVEAYDLVRDDEGPLTSPDKSCNLDKG